MQSFDPDMLCGTVITSRIRLARNLRSYPFSIQDKFLAREIVNKVNRALIKSGDFELFFIQDLDDISLEMMKEQHLISVNLMQNKDCGAVLIDKNQKISVMVNEEDVIREQSFNKGFRLQEAYAELSKIDDALSKNLDLAFDSKFGYLTACPTNLGTGMRASVMMFLPALSESGKIEELKKDALENGLTARGIYGEGSSAEGYMYQISNEVTLGFSEEEILDKVESAALSICRAEREEEERLYGKNQLFIMDKARKSFGVLTNAVLLPYSEFLSHIASVKLGAMLGVINMSEPEQIESIDELIVDVRPASLCKFYGKNLSQMDRDLYRAEYVGKKLIKLSNS